MAQPKIVIAFDLYGTLLSTESISDELAKHYGEEQAKAVAALWRRYQLEYSWRITCMGIYRTFSTLTLAALHHATAELSLPPLTASDAASLMSAYDSLHAFPDVPGALSRLAADQAASSSSSSSSSSPPSVESWVFSNGTAAMVSASLRLSPAFSAGSTTSGGVSAALFKGVVTVDDVAKFKPHPAGYAHLLEAVGVPVGRPERVWLITANPFDVVGARHAGIRAAWIDRAGKGWVDGLGEAVAVDEGGGKGVALRPTVVAKGVDEAVEKIMGYGAE